MRSFAVLLGVLFALSLVTTVGITSDDTSALNEELKNLQDRIDKLEAAPETTPTVESKTGTIKVGVLLKQWYVSTDQKFEGHPDETDYNNRFMTRHARLNLTGALTDKLGWYTQFDFARNDNEAESYDEALLDLWLNYTFDKRSALTVGQFKIPFGYETLVPTGDLETVERALVFSSTKIGNYWDVGLQYTGTFPSAEIKVALVQGAGQNRQDTDDRLDACARVNFKPRTIPGLEVGGSVYAGRNGVVDDSRDYWGGHIVYKVDKLKIMGEYVTGNTMVYTGDTVGWYGLASYMIRTDLGFVFRYEELELGYPESPFFDGSGPTIKSWTAGLNYYLLKNNAKIQVDYMHYSDHNDIIVNFQIKA